MAEKTTPPKTSPKTPEGDRIAKVLSRAGIASRREAERMIELGEVSVNGKVITSPALNVTPSDKIMVRGQQISEPEPARLWLYYKPEGLVTSEADEKGRETVFDNLPPELPRVMSIGRLDLNSEGLLLLTNDGALKRRLELPSTGWLRKYRVRVNGNPMDPDLEPLRRGIEVEGERFQPMNVVIDRIQGANAWLTVGLREGKNREIRRAMAAINLTVNRLIRISYGPFRLGDMEPGQVEEIKGKVLRDQLGEGRTPVDEARPRKPTRSVLREGKMAIERNAAARVSKDLADRGIEPPVRRSFGTAAALNALSKTWDRATAPKGGTKSSSAKPLGAKPLGAKPAAGTSFGGKPATTKPTVARSTRNSAPKRGPKGG
jgi:23S rRNA pseudouridine2605 synthase